MSIFDKPISQLGEQDLKELIQDFAVENIRLEFKKEVPNKDEMLKKLSSFANTFGGFVVVGAEADSKDGRILALPGVDVQPSYKQTLVQWCFGSASPPLNIEVSDPIPAPKEPGKVCYVICIRESDLAPHFLNGRKGIYVRTDEFSSRFEARLASENEIRHLLNRRELIRIRRTALIDRARLRFQSYTQTRYAEFRNPAREPKESIGARFDLTIIPRFPTEPVCDHAELIELVRSERIPWRQVGFPRDVSILSQYESAISLGAASTFSILEANVWGMLFFASEIEERTKTKNVTGITGIHLNQFLGNMLAFTRYAAQVLSRLRYAGPLRVEIRMEGMQGVKWMYFYCSLPEHGPCSELDDTIHFSLDTATDLFIGEPDKLAMEILRCIFLATNWDSRAESLEELKHLRKLAYDYNYWGNPKQE